MTGIALSPRTRRRVNARLLDALTWIVLLVMLAPVLWLLIASTQTKLHLATGEIDVLHPTLKAEELLHITRLSTVFEVFESETEAVRSFGPD